MTGDEFYALNRAAWRQWLSEHADRGEGVWVIYDKGPSRVLTYDDIVEEALCFGWVDSIARRRSESQAMLYVAPRKPGSGWSRLNKSRVERLMRAGLMQPRGLAVVETAKIAGSWTALDDVEALIEPDDLAVALAAQPGARTNWDAFPRSTKRAILEWIASAKRPSTRAARVRTTVEEAAVGRRANQWRQPKGT